MTGYMINLGINIIGLLMHKILNYRMESSLQRLYAQLELMNQIKKYYIASER